MARLFGLQDWMHLSWLAVALKVAIGWSTHCATVISVSSNCSEAECWPSYIGDESNRFACGSLQKALELAGRQTDGNCTEILLHPGERYSMTSSVAINSSLVMRSSDPDSPARVSVDVTRTSSPDYEPFYVLSLVHADFVKLKRIEFSHSPGIVHILRVKTVEIIDCAFRYEFFLVGLYGSRAWRDPRACGHYTHH